ncbi:DNA-directed RNA polymerase sigma-70 factor [Bacteroidota bacterium]|nr:DNA-directed RNA polymerase sigma-70 factor [Bacteroidota bacterium]
MTNQQEPKEHQLLRQCIAGDRKAQQGLYDLFAPMVYAICLRYMGNSDDAKDMLQETMVKFYQKAAEFRFQGSLGGWVKRIGVNACLDQLKRNKGKFTTDIENAFGLSGDVNAAQPLETKDLMRLLGTLPVGYRTVFNLYAIEGFSHGEIATLLSISENTSKSQLFKARKWLQSKLERN